MDKIGQAWTGRIEFEIGIRDIGRKRKRAKLYFPRLKTYPRAYSHDPAERERVAAKFQNFRETSASNRSIVFLDSPGGKTRSPAFPGKILRIPKKIIPIFKDITWPLRAL